MESLVAAPLPHPTDDKDALYRIISSRTYELAVRNTKILDLERQIDMLNRLILRQKKRIKELEAHQPYAPTVAQTCMKNLNNSVDVEDWKARVDHLQQERDYWFSYAKGKLTPEEENRGFPIYKPVGKVLE